MRTGILLIKKVVIFRNPAIIILMKITILEPAPEEDDEIIVKCHFLDDDITLLLNQLKNGSSKMNFSKENKIIHVKYNFYILTYFIGKI